MSSGLQNLEPNWSLGTIINSLGRCNLKLKFIYNLRLRFSVSIGNEHTEIITPYSLQSLFYHVRKRFLWIQFVFEQWLTNPKWYLTNWSFQRTHRYWVVWRIFRLIWINISFVFSKIWLDIPIRKFPYTMIKVETIGSASQNVLHSDG